MTSQVETYYSNPKSRSAYSGFLRCIYQNVRGLRTKVTNFNNSVTACEYDIIALSETWLSNDIRDGELFPNTFIVHRDDRHLQALGVSRGGGVLLAVRDFFTSIRIDLSSVSDAVPIIDIVGVKLMLDGGRSLFIFVVYIPPRVSVADFERFFDLLNGTGLLVHEFVILGDFNTPGFHDNITDSFTTTLHNFVDFHDLRQCNNISNTYGRLLDLVFSNLSCDVGKALDPLVEEDGYHPALSIDILMKSAPFRNFAVNTEAESFNFRKTNFPLLYERLASQDWSDLDLTMSVDDACSKFYQILHQIFESTVPKQKMKTSHRYPSWFDSEIIREIRKKQSLFRNYKKYRSQDQKKLFERQRSRVKKLIAHAYDKFIEDVENSLCSEPQKFWSFIHKKRNNTRLPGVMKCDDVELSTPQTIVDSFAEYFGSVYTPSDSSNVQPPNFSSSPPSVSIEHISEDEIIRALKRSKNSFTAGVDGIPSFLLRDCACVFGKPLQKIFNLILRRSTFPSIWKKSFITPVHKKGTISDVKNYRPISLLCNFAKTFESILYHHIYSAVKSHISPHQHGFMEKRSTVSNLACFKQFVAEVIDDGGQVDVIYTDFQKAFDQIDHFALLQKLKSFGFSEALLSLFSSYLRDREQFVKYQNFISRVFVPSSGVPQGSNLGPLLFLIFINDIVNGVVSERLLFADDLKLFLRVVSVSDAALLQRDIEAIEGWCIANRLYLNVSKCKVMTFSKKRSVVVYPYIMSGSILQRCDSVKDLGVTFDPKLDFSHHRANIVSQSYKMYGMIYRNCGEFRNCDALKTLYFALIRSRLEYCSVIWYPYYKAHIHSIELVQRRYLKFLSFLEDGVYPIRGIDYTLLLTRFSFISLETRRTISVIKLLHNILNNNLDCSYLLSKINFFVPRSPSSVRRPITFYNQTSRTNILFHSPVSLMCYEFNKFSSKCDINFHSIKFIILQIHRSNELLL